MRVKNIDTGEVKGYYGTVQDIQEYEPVTYHVTTTKEGDMEKIEESEFNEHYKIIL